MRLLTCLDIFNTLSAGEKFNSLTRFSEDATYVVYAL